jgi:retron-type reverse transcriptase
MSIGTIAPNFSNVMTVDGVARALQISTPILEAVLNSKNPEELYRLHKIPKHSQSRHTLKVVLQQLDEGATVESLGLFQPKVRLVWESISRTLKLAHKSAAHQLEKFLLKTVTGYPHPNAYGYIRGRSTRDNAQRHAGALKLASADLQDFFPNITLGMVETALLKAGMSEEAAQIIARFVTIDGKLAAGINASPLIANLVALPLDIELTAFCDAKNVVYTRYADDLTFSAKNQDAELPTPSELNEILRKHLFQLNEKKYRLSKRGQKHYVTGLSVSDPIHPHAPKKLKRRLRQELYYISKRGISQHLNTIKGGTIQGHVNRIDGMVNYIASIERAKSSEIRSTWKSICQANDIERSYSPRPYDAIRHIKWYVDETEVEDVDGAKCLALVCVEFDNSEYVERLVLKFSSIEAEDAYITPTAAKTLRTQGPHWAELNVGQRERFVNLLSQIDCRCVVAVDHLNQGSYEDTYLRLLAKIADQMMRSTDDAVLQIFVEQNRSKVPSAKIAERLLSVYRKLTEANERRPTIEPKISIIDKTDSYLSSIPDALAGTFRSYAEFTNERPRYELLFFERLDSRYKTIFDETRHAVYSRKNRFKPWHSQA